MKLFSLRTLLGALPLLLLSARAPDAAAREPRAQAAERAAARGRFLGPHPVAARLGGGYCYIDVPHLHDYVPDRPALYQQVGEGYLFTGDPVPFGYEGPRTVFYGPHPVQAHLEVELPSSPIYCGLRGPHHHDYAPPPVPDFKVQGGVVFYVGPLAPEYLRQRPRIERALEDEYRPFVAARPQVTVTPPPEWQGELWVPPPPPSVVVTAPAAPSVVVSAPAPSVVVTPPRVHFVAPAPQVVVAPPVLPGVIIAPPVPGVIIAPPGPPGVIIAPGRRIHPGKHHGWGRGKHHGWGRHD